MARKWGIMSKRNRAAGVPGAEKKARAGAAGAGGGTPSAVDVPGDDDSGGRSDGGEQLRPT